MTPTEERKEWLRKAPNDSLAKQLSKAAWIVTALVLILVALMRSPYKIPLPDGWSMSFLPLVHAVINALVSVCLVGAIIAVKRGRIATHRNFMLAAMALSTLFLICYVAYHFTTVETRYGGEGVMPPPQRVVGYWRAGGKPFELTVDCFSACASKCNGTK